MQFSVTLGN